MFFLSTLPRDPVYPEKILVQILRAPAGHAPRPSARTWYRSPPRPGSLYLRGRTCNRGRGKEGGESPRCLSGVLFECSSNSFIRLQRRVDLVCIQAAPQDAPPARTHTRATSPPPAPSSSSFGRAGSDSSNTPRVTASSADRAAFSIASRSSSLHMARLQRVRACQIHEGTRAS